ncbi:hypothetical protein ESCO47_00138 [Escherichia phage vB_EcoM_ESCO47]|nr:hypothetical protein ESCO47_00138 [Escherichia phage vB_EcoM_ESCO47]
MKANLYHIHIDGQKFPIEVLIPSEWSAYNTEMYRRIEEQFLTSISPKGYEVEIRLAGEFHYDPSSPFDVSEIIINKGFVSPGNSSSLYGYINDIIICGNKFSIFHEEDLREFKKLVWNYFGETGFNFIKAPK